MHLMNYRISMMKSFFKEIYKWATLLLHSLVSLLSEMIFSSRASAQDVKSLSKKSKVDSCIILGNGPSLKDVLSNYQDCLKEYETVAVNIFCSSEAFEVIMPKYYVLTDPGFFDDKAKDERLLDIQNKAQQGFSRVSWDMVLFLPSINRRSSLVKRINNRHIRICFYNLTPIDGFLSLQHWLFKRNLGMPVAMNVLCASIFLMNNIGYKRIYLLGADHSWLESFYINENNELILGDKHFYGSQNVHANETLSAWLHYLSVGFRSHERLAEYAHYLGHEVINLTADSYIDAYPRKDISEIVQNKIN